MPSPCTQNAWLRYKRLSDNVKVEGRLVFLGGEKFIEIKEPRMHNLCCPACQEVLTSVGGTDLPNFYLPPAVFHAKYRPIS